MRRKYGKSRSALGSLGRSTGTVSETGGEPGSEALSEPCASSTIGFGN